MSGSIISTGLLSLLFSEPVVIASADDAQRAAFVLPQARGDDETAGAFVLVAASLIASSSSYVLPQSSQSACCSLALA